MEPLMLCPAAAFDHTPLPHGGGGGGALVSLGVGLEGLGGLRKPLGQRQQVGPFPTVEPGSASLPSSTSPHSQP